MTYPGGIGGRAVFVECPPSSKRRIRADVKTLFWWWGFGEGIGHIRTKDDKAFGGGNGVEEAGAGMVGAVSVCVVEHPDLPTASRSVASAAGLFAAVDFFHCVSPDKVEDGEAVGYGDWEAKHVL